MAPTPLIQEAQATAKAARPQAGCNDLPEPAHAPRGGSHRPSQSGGTFTSVPPPRNPPSKATSVDLAQATVLQLRDLVRVAIAAPGLIVVFAGVSLF